jgi:hypothetical protein
MRARFAPHSPWLALGMTSLVLGFIGLLLFFLPILGIPISLFGMAFGVAGFVVALFARGPALRWSMGGIALSGMALTVNLAIANAPGGVYLPIRAVPKSWQPVPNRPQAPPPASQQTPRFRAGALARS